MKALSKTRIASRIIREVMTPLLRVGDRHRARARSRAPLDEVTGRLEPIDPSLFELARVLAR
jgi:hypothetical protein